MKLKPKNNWIEVSLAFDKAEEEYEKSLVALPEDYKPLEKPYKTVSVVSDPDMSKKGWRLRVDFATEQFYLHKLIAFYWPGEGKEQGHGSSSAHDAVTEVGRWASSPRMSAKYSIL